MKIFVQNPPTDHLEKSFLSKSYASGVSSVLVKNTDRFANNQPILIGAMGRERSEISSVNGAPTATTLGLDPATDFSHDADDPVFVLEYDQLRIYRSTTGINGAYNLLDTVPLDVDNADNRTYFDDPNALTNYYYKLAYYHSIDDVESDQTPAIAASGYDARALGTIIPEVAREVKDPDFMYMDIDTYISTMNDISDDLLTQAKRPYRFLKKNPPASLDTVVDGSAIDLPTDLWKVNKIKVNEVSPAMTRTFRPRQVSADEARYQLSVNTTAGDWVDGVAIDDETNELLFFPKARTIRVAAFLLSYYKKFDRFTDFSDLVETPNGLVYKLGLKRQFYTMKADEDTKWLAKAKEFEKQYTTEVMKLQREKNIMADGPTGLAPDRKRYPQWGGRRYKQ